jgi:Cu2+-exporting ATPase
MSASTVVVALNAQLLRRLDLTPAASAAALREQPPVRAGSSPG